MDPPVPNGGQKPRANFPLRKVSQAYSRVDAERALALLNSSSVPARLILDGRGGDTIYLALEGGEKFKVLRVSLVDNRRPIPSFEMSMELFAITIRVETKSALFPEGIKAPFDSVLEVYFREEGADPHIDRSGLRHHPSLAQTLEWLGFELGGWEG